MKCPFCGKDDTRVIDSRPADDNTSIRRRRVCDSCGKRFTTYEKVETIPLIVIKKGDVREPYDRAKIEAGVLRACHKRPVSAEQISRIVDAVEAAGGFSEDADTTYVNLAARLTDGTKLLIPTLEQTADRVVASGIDSFSGDTTLQTASVSEGSGGNGLVNINTADKEELKSLNGIGDSTAEKIIRYRQDNGGFRTIEDIMKISGIKEKLFSKIKDNITV